MKKGSGIKPLLRIFLGIIPLAVSNLCYSNAPSEQKPKHTACEREAYKNYQEEIRKALSNYKKASPENKKAAYQQLMNSGKNAHLQLKQAKHACPKTSN